MSTRRFPGGVITEGAGRILAPTPGGVESIPIQEYLRQLAGARGRFPIDFSGEVMPVAVIGEIGNLRGSSDQNPLHVVTSGTMGAGAPMTVQVVHNFRVANRVQFWLEDIPLGIPTSARMWRLREFSVVGELNSFNSYAPVSFSLYISGTQNLLQTGEMLNPTSQRVEPFGPNVMGPVLVELSDRRSGAPTSYRADLPMYGPWITSPVASAVIRLSGWMNRAAPAAGVPWRAVVVAEYQ